MQIWLHVCECVTFEFWRSYSPWTNPVHSVQGHRVHPRCCQRGTSKKKTEKLTFVVVFVFVWHYITNSVSKVTFFLKKWTSKKKSLKENQILDMYIFMYIWDPQFLHSYGIGHGSGDSYPLVCVLFHVHVLLNQWHDDTGSMLPCEALFVFSPPWPSSTDGAAVGHDMHSVSAHWGALPLCSPHMTVVQLSLDTSSEQNWSQRLAGSWVFSLKNFS